MKRTVLAGAIAVAVISDDYEREPVYLTPLSPKPESDYRHDRVREDWKGKGKRKMGRPK